MGHQSSIRQEGRCNHQSGYGPFDQKERMRPIGRSWEENPMPKDRDHVFMVHMIEESLDVNGEEGRD